MAGRRHEMKLIGLFAAAVATFAALSSSAAIITLDGPSTAMPGETILLTATASTGVGPADMGGVSIVAHISYTNAFVNTNEPGSSQNPVIPGWTNGVLNCTTSTCRVFNQIAPVGSLPTVPALN